MDTGNNIKSKRGNWSFSGNVAENFVTHAEKSIPYYHEGHDLVCKLSDYFCVSNSLCYEIGSSTGQLTRKLAEYNKHKNSTSWIGIDSEDNMIKKAKVFCKEYKNINFKKTDINSFNFKSCDLICSYYVIQFIHPSNRQNVISKIYDALNWGGGFIWFEKVRAPDARFQDITVSMYNDFKTEKGFNATEILSKTASLRGVLEPFSTQGNIDLLRRAGFVDYMTVFKHVCFEGFLAIK